jgi:hypothetical protein
MLTLLELNCIEVDFTDDDITRIGLELANGDMSDSQLLDLDSEANGGGSNGSRVRLCVTLSPPRSYSTLGVSEFRIFLIKFLW